MRNFFGEFKKFAMRGNVVDLAVAVVIGAAFGKIVSALVEHIIMPLTSVLTGGADFSNLAVHIGEAELTYGVFVQSIVDFIIVAFAIFLAVKVMNNIQRKEDKKEEGKAKEPTEEIRLLREIRNALQK